MLTLAPPQKRRLKLRDKYQYVPEESTMIQLEKAEPVVETFGGITTMDQIGDALDEFSRLFKVGLASDAEILTLARAFPDNPKYTTAAINIPDEAVMVVGGPASVELIDREGHLITTNALRSAFKKYMDNFRTRNAMVLHSDVQVGWALPAYITKGGLIYKSDVGIKGLFFLCEIRSDTKIAERVREQIKNGKLKSYSIAGSATKVQNMTKGIMPYMQVDEMELAEVTVCEKGVNQGASFDLLKAEQPEQTGKISKEQCGYREATPAELEMDISCGSCVYFNKQDASCDTVVGDIYEDDYCIVYKPENSSPDTMETEEAEGIQIEIHLSKRDDGSVDFTRSFLDLIRKEVNPFRDVKAAKFLGEHPPGQAHLDNPVSGKPMTFDEGGGTGTWADSQLGKYQTYMRQNDPEAFAQRDTPKYWEEFHSALEAGKHPQIHSPQEGGADLSEIDIIEDEKDKWAEEDAYMDAAMKDMFDEQEKWETDNPEQHQAWKKFVADQKAKDSDSSEYNKIEALNHFIKQDEMDQTVGRGVTITPKTKKLAFQPSPAEEAKFLGAGAVAKMGEFVSDSQRQWTLNEEPPSFNWGPYGLQSKSNVGD